MGGAQKFDLPTALFSTEDEPTGLLKWAGATEAADGSLKAKVKKKPTRTIGAAQFVRAEHDVEEMIRSGDWSRTQPRHLVALYAIMHERIYGVEPAELGPRDCYNAAIRAAALVKREFAGDCVAAVEYMRWAWDREEGRVIWREKNGREPSRISVWLMFSGQMLSDMRVEQKAAR